MPAFYISSEASIKYEIVGPTGVRAVLNDPSDPDFCGYLDGEEAITGIDSPELRDSFTEMAAQDGSVPGNSYVPRRPIVMNGRVIPTSAADRNAKLGKLQAATDARFADGTLSWTPSGGEPVFLKFRRQLPFRSKGGFNKEFILGLVANDPRIYSKRAYTIYTETNAVTTSRDYRRFTWASGSGTTLATRSLYLPPGEWLLKLPIKRSTASGTLRIDASNSIGTHTPDSLTTGWTEVVQTRVTANAANVATTISLILSAAMTTGQWVEIGDLRVESADGLFPAADATFATNWTAGSGYTASFQSATPPPAIILNPGNALSRPRQRIIGPFTGVAPMIDFDTGVTPTTAAYVEMTAASYSASDYAVLDYGFKTILKNNTTNDYATVSPANSPWGGLPPEQVCMPRIWGFAGLTAATRMETTFRGVWL